jgi:hypothetical protein
MLYRVVLYFPDVTRVADFVEKSEAQGEVDTSIHTFAATLNDEQITLARKSFGAHVRLLRCIKAI